MLVSPGSPEGPCVDAARDSMYCPQEVQAVPRAAPRGNPPTPKPRSGNGLLFVDFFLFDAKRK